MSGTPVRNLRHGKIIIQDGSGSPKQLQIIVDEGNLTFTEKDPTFVISSRGVILSRSQGDETPLDIGFGVMFSQWSYAQGASTGLSMRDVCKGSQAAKDAGWISTSECGPWSIDIIYQLQDPCAPANYEQLLFKYVHIEQFDYKEGKEFNTLEAKGQALQGEPIRTYVTG